MAKDTKQNNNFMVVPNVFFENLYRSKLNGSELRVVLFIYRMTAGYNMSHRQMSASYISNGTGVPIDTIRRTINSLIDKEIVGSFGNQYKSYFVINPGQKWVVKNDKGVVKNDKSKNPETLVILSRNPGQKRPPIKDNIIKDNIIKDSSLKNNSANSTFEDKNFEINLADVEQYCKEKNYTFDYEKFFNYYNATDWIIRGQAITNWKSLADNWQRTERKKENKKNKESFDVSEYEDFSIFDE